MTSCVFSIEAEHPCLAGHFPGNPIVPGVVVLERVIEALAAGSEWRAVGIRRCKFSRPLRPGEPCTIEWTPHDDAVRFVCSSAQGMVARGVLQVARG